MRYGGRRPARPASRDPSVIRSRARMPWSNLSGIPAVARCTSIIVDELAAVPWKLYGGADGRTVLPMPDWITDPQALRLDGRVVDTERRPERPAIPRRLLELLAHRRLMVGRRRSSTRRPATRAARPSRRYGSSTRSCVELRDGGYSFGDCQLDSTAIIHLRGPGPIVGGRGYGRLRALRRRARLHAHRQGLRRVGLLLRRPVRAISRSTRTGSPKTQADKLRTNWDAKHGGPNRQDGRPQFDDRLHPADLEPDRRDARRCRQRESQRARQCLRRPGLHDRRAPAIRRPMPTSKGAGATS